MSGSQAMPEVDQAADLLLPNASAMAHSEGRVECGEPARHAEERGVHARAAAPTGVRDSQFGKRDTGQPHAEAHQFRVYVSVEILRSGHAAAEIASLT